MALCCPLLASSVTAGLAPQLPNTPKGMDPKGPGQAVPGADTGLTC